MINHVLVPLDGSQLAEKALPIARQVVRSGGQITLLSAVHDMDLNLLDMSETGAETSAAFANVQSTMRRIQEYLEHIGKNLQLQGYQVAVEVAGGEPADAIIQYAEKLHADMIIMSTHGRSGLSRLLFGSITLKVLEASAIPIVVVPNRERIETAEPEINPETGISPAS